jgi:hypothetical protein
MNEIRIANSETDSKHRMEMFQKKFLEIVDALLCDQCFASDFEIGIFMVVS